MRASPCWMGCLVFVGTSACDCRVEQPPNDVAVDANLDSTVEMDAEEELDTFRPTVDARPGPARVVWRADTAPDCSRHAVEPRWSPGTEPGEPGTLRWLRAMGSPPLRAVLDSNPISAVDPISAMPVGTDSGIVAWSLSGGFEIGLDFATGDLVHYGSSTTSAPTNAAFPRLWLPDEAGIHGLRQARSPISAPPSITGPFAPAPAVLSIEWDSPTTTYSSLPTSFMPAWSPVSGTRFIAAGGPEGRGVASACAEGVAWVTLLPIDPSEDAPGVMFVRADGDLLVATQGTMWVLDADSGEPLRTAEWATGVDDGLPGAYHPGCGLLVERTSGREWFWLDDETLQVGPAIRLRDGDSSAEGAWTGTADCGLVVAARDSVIRFDRDGSMRHELTAEDFPADFSGASGPPIPTEDGGFLLVTRPPGWIHFSALGVRQATVRLPDAGGASSFSEPLLAPDGSLYFVSYDSLTGFLAFGAANTGIRPGPFLWPDSGLNWAHTNSPLTGPD